MNSLHIEDSLESRPSEISSSCFYTMTNILKSTLILLTATLEAGKIEISDNIFVIQAILNETKNGDKEPIDISVYDVEKCFDSLRVQECLNDMFDAGIQNDKLNL